MAAPVGSDNWDPGFGDPGLQIAFGGAEQAAAGPSAMCVDAQGNVYLAGGNWNRLDGTSFVAQPNFAVWSREGGEWSTFGNNATAAGIFEMAAHGTDVYCGGQWSLFFDGGGILPAKGVVKWDGTAWSALGTGIEEGPFGLPASVEAMAFDAEGNLYVGGQFAKAGGLAARNVAKWDGVAWSPLGAGLESRVATLAFGPDGKLYAGGVFNEGLLRRVACWDGSEWQPLGAGFTSGEVAALVFDGEGNIYAGGSFQFITAPDLGPGFVSANRVARWDGSAWSPLGAGVNDNVRSLAFANGALIAGGSFSATGDGTTSLNNLAVWDGAGWQSLGGGTSHSGGGNATVFHLLVSADPSNPSRSQLVAGGPFDRAGEHPANNVALWNLGASPDPSAPRLQLSLSDDEGFNLLIESEAGVVYEILFAPALAAGFSSVTSVPGDGGMVSATVEIPDSDAGFYVVIARRPND